MTSPNPRRFWYTDAIALFWAILCVTIPWANGEPTPTPVANGKIAFISQRDGPSEVYLMDADGANQTRVTHGPSANPFAIQNPALSSDGTKIAFSKRVDGNSYNLYRINSDGSNEIRLTDTTNAIGGDIQPDWSPDGSKIVFASNRDGNYEIYVMNADGSNQVNLTNNSTDDNSPSWSPDGTKIAFDSNRITSSGLVHIFTMNADGSNPIRLTQYDYNADPTWSPDGLRIAFGTLVFGGNDIAVINVDGSNLTRLTYTNNAARNPSWSKDGTKIAFTFFGPSNRQIYSIDANGANQINLTPLGASEFNPNWQKPLASVFPSPTPQVMATISGSVFSCSNPSPAAVGNVTLTVNGDIGGTAVSDDSGYYELLSLPIGGTCDVTPSKGGLTPGSPAINTVDILAVQRHFLGINLLTGCRLAAADVSGDTNINTVDAIAMQRFFLGLTIGIANTGKYQFIPPSRNYIMIVPDQTNENYDALVLGDVAAPFVD